jgi:hypothetical protein
MAVVQGLDHGDGAALPLDELKVKDWLTTGASVLPFLTGNTVTGV